MGMPLPSWLTLDQLLCLDLCFSFSVIWVFLPILGDGKPQQAEDCDAPHHRNLKTPGGLLLPLINTEEDGSQLQAFGFFLEPVHLNEDPQDHRSQNMFISQASPEPLSITSLQMCHSATHQDVSSNLFSKSLP